MADIQWFTRREPGSPVAVHKEDSSLLIISRAPPAWIELPPDLGGVRVEVVATAVGPCPKCQVECRHLATKALHKEQPIAVAECVNEPTCGFVWYTRRKPA